MFNLGYMYERGLGLPRDLHLAKRYYDLALEAAPEAWLPVQLARLQLWLMTALEDILSDKISDGSALATEANKVATEASALPNNKPNQPPLASDTHAPSAAPELLKRAQALYIKYEDAVLAVLLLLLVCVAVRRGGDLGGAR
jgi:TPR repeat protein